MIPMSLGPIPLSVHSFFCSMSHQFTIDLSKKLTESYHPTFMSKNRNSNEERDTVQRDRAPGYDLV